MALKDQDGGQVVPRNESKGDLLRGAVPALLVGLLCFLNWALPYLLPLVLRHSLFPFTQYGRDARVALLLVDIAAQVLAISGLIFAGMKISGQSLCGLGLARSLIRGNYVLGGLAIGGICGIAVWSLEKFINYHPIGLAPGLVGAISALRVVVISPFLEELFFRGLIYKLLEEKVSAPVNILLNSFLYALTHYYFGAFLCAIGVLSMPGSVPSIGAVPVYFGVGLVFSTLRFYSKSLWPSLAAHMGYNLALAAL